MIHLLNGGGDAARSMLASESFLRWKPAIHYVRKHISGHYAEDLNITVTGDKILLQASGSHQSGLHSAVGDSCCRLDLHHEEFFLKSNIPA